MGAPAGAPLKEIEFAGLSSREHPHRIPIEAALTCSDCVTDTDAVSGRPGSRAVTAAAIVGSGTFQHAGRFRPSSTVAITVVVIAGEVWIISDPSSETASDGGTRSLGVPGTTLGLSANWNTSSNISGTGMGKNYYLATSQGATLGVRIVWDEAGTALTNFALESLAGIAPGAKPTATPSSTAWVTYRGKTFTDSGISRANDAGSSYWIIATPTAANDSTYVDLGVGGIDMSRADWLAVGVSPHDGGDTTISVHVSEDASAWVRLGSTKDITSDGVGGSPDILYLDLTQMDAAARDAIRYVKFIAEGNSNSGHPFLIYGHLLVPRGPLLNPETYVVTFQNTVTLSESKPSEPRTVAITTGFLPTYDLRYYDTDSVTGTGTISPISGTNNYIYNRQAGITLPAQADIGQIVTVAGNAPTLIGAGPFLVRLWKLTDTGYRIVIPAGTPITSGAAYSLVDYGGDGILANELLKLGGSMPALNCLTSNAQRLIGMGTGLTANRVYISSYTPTSATTNPVPQWPDIATEDADGWSFDIAPSPKEQGLVANGEGDAVYLSTNEATYAMSDLTPNSLPWLILRRGTLSRHGGGYFEDRYLWVAWDGVYEAVGKSSYNELSFPVKKTYQNTFAPDSNACIGYNQRERALYVCQDTKYLRFYFPLKRWSSGTLAMTVRQILSWFESVVPQMWLCTDDRKIGRWQSAAIRDMLVGTSLNTGTKIPNWIYSTGWDKTPSPTVMKGVLLDADDDITVTVSKTIDAADKRQARSFTVGMKDYQDEVWREVPADLRAYKFRIEFSGENATTLRTASFSRSGVEAVGG